MVDTYSPDDWLYIPIDQIDQLDENVTWPFTRVSKTQFMDLLKLMGTRTVTNAFLRIAGSILSGFGIVCTCLLICSLWRKAVDQQNGFYRAMLLIALLDLAYNIFSLFHYAIYKTYKLSGSSSFALMAWLVANRGLMYTVSLANDMCAVVLTLERYLAIAKAHFHKILLENHKILVTAVMAACVVLVSVPRMHYAMDLKVVRVESLFFFTPSEFGSTSFVKMLAMVADVILPIILLVTMLGLSTMFRVAVTKRMKKQMGKSKMAAQNRVFHQPGAVQPSFSKISSNVPISSTNQQQTLTQITRVAPVEGPVDRPAAGGNTAEASNPDLKSIVVLTLSLDALFIMNQLGYCFYFAAEKLLDYSQITYTSGYQDVATRVNMIRLEAYADLTSSLAELLSHAANFLLYTCLSSSTRHEFRVFIKRLC